MKLTRRTTISLMGATAATALLPAAARANGEVHEIEMLNRHPDDNENMVFHPDIIEAKPGDTIRFVSTDKGHNAVSYEDMLPEGAEEFKTKVNQDEEIVLEAEGAYGFYCQPHKALGMVGLILVGDASSNYESLKDADLGAPKERERWEDIFSRADEIVGGSA